MGELPFASDPFPNVPPALLNSADLRAYAEAGENGKRLFEPFFPDERGRLKSASYEIPFRGASYSWKGLDDPTRHECRVGDDDELEIPQNGIVFVWPAVYFRIPPYLALRFNLTIRLVHRGLLLGTGPLVDPGFHGRLLIPVHNLTDRPLTVHANDGFIWVEVTKVSPYPPLENAHSHRYVEFPKEKGGLDVGGYFEKANRGSPIRSSIPALVEESRTVSTALKSDWLAFELKQRSEVDAIASTVKRVQREGYLAIAVTVVGILATVIGMLFGVYQIAESTKQLVESTKSLVMAAQQSVDTARTKGDEETRNLSEKVKALEDKLKGPSAVVPVRKPAN